MNSKKQLYQCLKEMTSEVSTLSSRLNLFKSTLPNLETNQGLSLLQVKLHSLLSYLSHLSFIVLLKLQGKSIVDHPSIQSLIENRLLIEKMKPLEQKLKYQIDKLIKTALLDQDQQNLLVKRSSISQNEEGEEENVDPLQFKPNLAALTGLKDSKKDQQDMTSLEEKQTYKPPRLAPMPYLEEEAIQSQALSKKSGRVALDKASRSRLLKDLSAQYDDRPEEMSVQGSGYAGMDITASKEDKQWHEREAFEEENFTRLNMTRKDKKLQKTLSRKGAMLRFENEFEDLERDFKSVSNQTRDDFGDLKNVMNGRKFAKTQFKQGKRSFDNANEFVSQASKSYSTQKPFKKALKRVKLSRK